MYDCDISGKCDIYYVQIWQGVVLKLIAYYTQLKW